MVTDNKYPTIAREFYGLSTDTKPTDSFDGLPVTNGSAFVEVDTGNVYLFNEASGSWVKV